MRGLHCRLTDGDIESLADHKLDAAEKFATEGGLTQAVNRVDDAVKRLTDRMDRYFEGGESKAPRRSRSPPA